LLPNFDEEQAMATARRLLSAIRMAIAEHNGQQHSVTASIGVATAPPDASDKLDEIADERQRQAKKLGKNQVVGRTDVPPTTSSPGPGTSNPSS
jgi:diguanylate cyclase (GGDEF)-like protein